MTSFKYRPPCAQTCNNLIPNSGSRLNQDMTCVMWPYILHRLGWCRGPLHHLIPCHQRLSGQSKYLICVGGCIISMTMVTNDRWTHLNFKFQLQGLVSRSFVTHPTWSAVWHQFSLDVMNALFMWQYCAFGLLLLLCGHVRPISFTWWIHRERTDISSAFDQWWRLSCRSLSLHYFWYWGIEFGLG